MNSKKVVVVGGGTAGLMAAHTLRKRGILPILLEANDRAGGRLGGDRVGDFQLDEAADFFTPAHDVALDLCGELGLPLVSTPQKVGWYRNRRFLVTDHSSVGPLTLIRNIPAMMGLGLLSPRALLALIRIVRYISPRKRQASFASDTRAAEADVDELFVDYLARIRAPEELIFVIRCFMDISMGDFHKFSVIQVMAYLNEIFSKGHLLRVPERGVGSLAHALIDRIGDGLRVSTPVRQVVIRDGLAVSVVVDGEVIEADAVICATTCTTAVRIIPGLPEPLRKALSRFEYSVGCRVVIGLDRHPLPPGWTAVLYPEDDTPLLLDRSLYLSACVPPGTGTLDLLVGQDRARELLPLDDEEIKRQLLADARRAAAPGSTLPADDEGIFTRVYRWPEAVGTPSPGTIKAVAEARRGHAGAVPNLFLAGDYTGMPSVNSALASGRDAANAAAGYLGSLER